MPETQDRETFLRRVADAVDLQPVDVAEVVEELGAHLDDATAGWVESGIEPGDAERRAINGLGDPVVLGREMGHARHRRRHLLAAVGGAVFNAFAFGIWGYLTLWLVGFGLAMIGGLIASWVFTAMGGSASGWFTGPVASAGTVVIATLWFAWLGWVLPGRVARAAHRSVRGVQDVVGLAGFAVATCLLWAWLTVDLDPLLAVGLPIGPLAFLLATRRASRGSSLFPPTRLRTRAGIAAAVVAAVALVGVLTVDTSGNVTMGGGWDPGLAALGSDPTVDPVLADLMANPEINVDGGYGSRGLQAGSAIVGGVTFADEVSEGVFTRRFGALELQIVPATVALTNPAEYPRLTVTGAPLASTSVGIPVPSLASAIRLPLPTLRSRTNLVAVLLGVRLDGTRVVLGFDTFRSPVWHGTLFDWWFTGR